MKKRRKIILVFVAIPIFIILGYFLNAFFGNPISKSKAEKEVLSYYEEKYNKDFEVYSSKYNFLIPDYNITMGPKDNKNAVFETSRYELTMYDSYGAFLATDKLKSKIVKLLKKEYPTLFISVKVDEEHHIQIAGVEFDFYSTDPQLRLEKNYFLATIKWNDTGLKEDETIKLMDEMSLKIDKELNHIPKQLSMEIYVKDKNGESDRYQRLYVNGQALQKQ